MDARQAMFVTGSVAISLDASLAVQLWKDKAQMDWDVAPLPKGPGGRGERIVEPEAPQPRIDFIARQRLHPGIDHRRHRKPPGIHR